MDTIKAINSRCSMRRYVEDFQIPEEDVKTILECAMKAPSAMNTRPWKFIVITNKEVLNKIAEVHQYAKFLPMASLAIIVVALPEVQENKCSNFYPQDCAAATQNILISATSLGYGSCWCGVYPNMDRVQVINDILNIKEGLTFNIIALGKSKYEKNGLGFFEEEKVSYIK